MMREPFYIAVEGPIGVGKTTLARLLSQAFNSSLLLEVFEENPFLSDFYTDRQRYAFQTQIFFLLSRYSQQNDRIPSILTQSSLVSDYLFAKDRIFAHLNLQGDELNVYERIHQALGENIPRPDLVVYLRASVDTLLQRIAFRDRPYERNMERDYIATLSRAYEAFFQEYREARVLVISTEGLNIVSRPEDRAQVIGRVRSALEESAIQEPLPGMEAVAPAHLEVTPPSSHRRLGDFQSWHKALDREKGFSNDIFLNFIALTEEIGEVAELLKLSWLQQVKMVAGGTGSAQAEQEAIQSRLPQLQEELADVLAFVLKIANDLDIDLESAYVEKMTRNWTRTWR